MCRKWLASRHSSNCVLSTATVAILVLSQSPHDLGLLATFALVPWLIALGRSGPLSAFVISVVVGVAYAILGANWLFAALESQGAHGIRGVLSGLIVALWGKGFLFGAIGLFVQRLCGRASAIRMITPAILFLYLDSSAIHIDLRCALGDGGSAVANVHDRVCSHLLCLRRHSFGGLFA